MKFYYRDNELNLLAKLQKQSEETGKMAVLLGRRRVGKTLLGLESVKGQRFLYLFIAKKSEVLLCEQFAKEIKQTLDINLFGKIENFKDIFDALMVYAKKNKLTIIIDEFQEFYSINSSVYSDIQKIWDLNKSESKITVIFVGSVYSLMSRIFEGQKEPLFGRADAIIHLQPFTVSQMNGILKDRGISNLTNLFELYVISGGMPKYLDLLLTNNCHDLETSLNYMLDENSLFLHEGRNQLIEEFGKDYTTYFSILELISRGKTGSGEIESILQVNVSAYLSKLEKIYNVITSVKPIDAKTGSKLQKYYIKDNFLQFWFRYFHRNRDAIEIRNFDYIKNQIRNNFPTYSGRILERFFVDLLIESKSYNRIGSYWERGGKNEIDIVAINDADKRILLAEVKCEESRNSLGRLEHRALKLLKKYPEHEISYQLLSLSDAEKMF